MGTVPRAAQVSQARRVHPIRVPATTQAPQLDRVGHQDLTHVGRKPIIDLEGTVGYLEDEDRIAVQVGCKGRPRLRRVGEPAVPFLLSRGRLRPELADVHVRLVEIQAEIAEHLLHPLSDVVRSADGGLLCSACAALTCGVPSEGVEIGGGEPSCLRKTGA